MASRQVVIEGIGRGLLMNNPSSMFAPRELAKGKRSTDKPTAEEDAAKSAYWTPDHSSLAFPAMNLWAGMKAASKGYKSPVNKKLALSPLIAGDVEVLPDMIPFGTADYQIDVRRAVVQRAGIPRARAWLPSWRLKFTVNWEAQFLGEGDGWLQENLEVLGTRVGIGDFRPQRGGPFGRFRVVTIE